MGLTGLPGPKNKKAKSKKFCSDFSSTGFKLCHFLQLSKVGKWLDHFVSGKQFRKRPNLDDWAFKNGQMATWVLRALRSVRASGFASVKKYLYSWTSLLVVLVFAVFTKHIQF